jgi:hypothetical protein
MNYYQSREGEFLELNIHWDTMSDPQEGDPPAVDLDADGNHTTHPRIDDEGSVQDAIAGKIMELKD